MDNKNLKTMCIISGSIMTCSGIVHFVKNYIRQKKQIEEMQELMNEARDITNRFVDKVNLSIIEE